MAIETVSRVFSEFEAEGILQVDRKVIEILRPQDLAEYGNIVPSFDAASIEQPECQSV